MTAHALTELHESQGQSLWLDNLSRKLLEDDGLPRLIAEYGIRGVTSNPSIFKKAIVGSDLYTDDLAACKRRYDEIESVYEHLVVSDIQRACDLLRPVWDASYGEDGWVSWEESPGIAHDAAQSVEAAHHLRKLVDRPNVLIKVPGTVEGIEAFERLIAAGVSVNVTLLFSLDQIKRVFAAYRRGLEQLEKNGGKPAEVRAVASLFMSRVDTLVDKKLDAIGGERAESLKGRAALALGGMAYQHFLEVFENNDDFRRFEQLGARPQYLLWASTGTKNPAYSDVLYVENLIAPRTINTVPDATLEAFADHGKIASTLKPRIDDDREVWEALADLGVDMDGAVRDQLLDEGIDQFQAAFDDLLEAIEKS
ncbi:MULTISPECIES: transaldolase [unclassified Guyparkeria]|uniref:transaldolase n=1 Tax=unclassified Guyparkeria TaxID=2626246 RepID=UPI0007337B00|nr:MULTISPECIES: transaldolase [unclassified Guyparkeria]KTG16649.1 transaldolase [Guyparkeria sp. XI15]OAE85683.1 transaldolase [Guyparkeria sp. WRN-7]